MTAKRPIGRCNRRLLIVVAVLGCLIGSCYARWPAKPTGLQKTFIKPDGQPITFTYWRAERVLKLPFFDGESAYIRFGDERVKMHGGDFGSGVGGFLVSPQRDVVIVERTFEGGATSGVLVDLKTGKFRRWSLFSHNPSVLGWSMESWKTSLENAPREQLYKELASADFEAMNLAISELDAREFIDADWLAMAEIVADSSAPASARKFLAFSMVRSRHEQVDRCRRTAHFGSSTMPATRRAADFDYSWPPKVDWPDNIVRLFEKAKDDSDSEVQKAVRSALDAMRGKVGSLQK